LFSSGRSLIDSGARLHPQPPPSQLLYPNFSSAAQAFFGGFLAGEMVLFFCLLVGRTSRLLLSIGFICRGAFPFFMLPLPAPPFQASVGEAMFYFHFSFLVETPLAMVPVFPGRFWKTAVLFEMRENPAPFCCVRLVWFVPFLFLFLVWPT